MFWRLAASTPSVFRLPPASLHVPVFLQARLPMVSAVHFVLMSFYEI
jgi:hypothetical protein